MRWVSDAVSSGFDFFQSRSKMDLSLKRLVSSCFALLDSTAFCNSPFLVIFKGTHFLVSYWLCSFLWIVFMILG